MHLCWFWELSFFSKKCRYFSMCIKSVPVSQYFPLRYSNGVDTIVISVENNANRCREWFEIWFWFREILIQRGFGTADMRRGQEPTFGRPGVPTGRRVLRTIFTFSPWNTVSSITLSKIKLQIRQAQILKAYNISYTMRVRQPIPIEGSWEIHGWRLRFNTFLCQDLLGLAFITGTCSQR